MSPPRLLMPPEVRTRHTQALLSQRLGGLSFDADHEKSGVQPSVSASALLSVARDGDLYIQELPSACWVRESCHYIFEKVKHLILKETASMC